ncbi:acetate/propionate family kinase [Legionella waltersii]|uniref:Acetate kinase n=1 Tax=Legionella waltersii TaxID=66969 RepID=A0A0W1A1S8_9GAMM|nr:acetate/propionate family kinase [Legionella waltersii]KTD75293.1 Acetate kinase (Acetokinase) [Legionella waltersii]SNV06971.1 Acetate kinase (Acetokinase) [Legionella waltersii]
MDDQHIIVINSGSSSIKFALFEFKSLNKALYGSIENIKIAPLFKLFSGKQCLLKEEAFSRDNDYSFYFELLLSSLKDHHSKINFVAAGHRVVHGGNTYFDPVLLTPPIIEDLKQLIPFAPLHQPYNLSAIEAITNHSPHLPQIACFDTAFHRSHPPIADAFALPRALTQEGIKRYGFHGLSYEFIMHQLALLAISKPFDRLIIAHLGNGASMCAIKNGKSIESTMGFTALDGLMMGTRCGSIDPGVLLYLLEFKQMTTKEIENLLYKQSGLLGVSGISSNVQQLLESDCAEAQEALDLFVYRARRELGALIAVLGGLDAFVFTGGIGEHAWKIREAICEDNEWIGIQLDKKSNKANKRLISAKKSTVDVYTIPTDEEWIIANHCQRILNTIR